MSEMFKLPEKRESKAVEDIYRREFGRVICQHKFYLPTQYCAKCDEGERQRLVLVIENERHALTNFSNSIERAVRIEMAREAVIRAANNHRCPDGKDGCRMCFALEALDALITSKP